jgi:hypothetical protein
MDTSTTSEASASGGAFPARNRSTAAWMSIAAVAALSVGLLAGPVLGAVAAPRGSSPTNAAATDNPPEHTISVTGSGKVTVIPDMATISLGVAIERPTAKAAREAAAAAMNTLVGAIRKVGIADKDIATASVSLTPVYDYPNNSAPRLHGYQLQNTVTVTVRDLATLSDVLDNGVTAGATTINGITFDVADRTAAEANARDAAVKDAKAKADALAGGLGVRITGVASVAETVSTPVVYQPMFAAGVTLDKAAATPLLPGSTDVVINVTVAFLIP